MRSKPAVVPRWHRDSGRRRDVVRLRRTQNASLKTLESFKGEIEYHRMMPQSRLGPSSLPTIWHAPAKTLPCDGKWLQREGILRSREIAEQSRPWSAPHHVIHASRASSRRWRCNACVAPWPCTCHLSRDSHSTELCSSNQRKRVKNPQG